MVGNGLHDSDGDRRRFVPHPELSRYYQPGERRRFLNALFDDSARYYDTVNRFMSLGSGASYRRDVLRRAGVTTGDRVLDVCVGTGLLARAAAELAGGASAVVGLDLSAGMLREAQRSLSTPLVRGLAERLPLASSSFDFVTMGYGLRHVDDLEVAFRECHRVLKPGGQLVLLEITRPSSRIRFEMARFYLKRVVPFFARVGAGGEKVETLMSYFWETIEYCVPQETVLSALRRVGFSAERSQLFDVFTDYVAEKPGDPSPVEAVL